MLWKKNSQPIYKLLATTSPTLEVIAKGELIVRYYSDDLGKFVAPKGIANEPILSKVADKQQADLARPIIMTAGIKDDTLNIFVAFHGPNILNLWYWGKQGSEPEQERKQLKVLFNYPKYNTLITDIFNFIAKGISDFINEGLSQINEDQKDLLSVVRKVNVFLGADANDPRGTMLNSILTNGLSVSLNEIEPVKFHHYKIDTTIENPDLLTCCANADSVLVTNNYVKTLGNVDKDTNERLKCYPADFFKPEKFAYYGDYALFGSSDTTITPYYMKKDNNVLQQYTIGDKTVIASDHLPVISTQQLSVEMAGVGVGGRRKTTRRNKKTHKRMRKYARMTHKRNGCSRKNRKNSRK